MFALLLALAIRFWPDLRHWGPAAQIPALLVLLSPLAYALYKALMVKSLRYEVTSERIRINSGILSRKTNALELYRVKDYTMEAPFFYRLFHLGNIYLTTSDHSTPLLSLKAIPHARKLIDDIRTQVTSAVT